MNKAVFLDRDGTITVDHGYLADPAGIELLPGAGRALARLADAGYLLVLVTNQSGVGRGMFSKTAVEAQHERLATLLEKFGVEFNAVKVCHHSPEEKCLCRKPSPTMILQAGQELNIDLRNSYLIGDKKSDIKAGQQAGCRTIKIGSDPDDLHECQVPNLVQAAGCILRNGKVAAIIPARYASTRFPGKPLVKILGKSMIQRVYEKVLLAEEVEEVLVATDDRRIEKAVREFGGLAAMTSREHPTGTDRIAEVAERYPADIVLNIQGDEPLLPSAWLDCLIREMRTFNAPMGTMAVPLENSNQDPNNPDLVKVVLDKRQKALYFSRSLIPFLRQGGTAASPLLHWGIYAYKKETLTAFVNWPQGTLEKSEMLEQLRALENGVHIHVTIADQLAFGVDRPEDIEKIEKILNNSKETVE